MPEKRFGYVPLNEVPADISQLNLDKLTKLDMVRGTEKISYLHALADIMGPLTVRERWELLGTYNLDPLRRNINLQGSAADAARGVIDNAFRRLYPPTAYVLKLINDNSNPSPLSSDMQDTLKALIIENPSNP